MRIFWVILALVVAGRVEAATVNAVSPGRADVFAAVSICPEGGIVAVPAGSATWSTGINVTKNITLQGAGTNLTIITANVDAAWESHPTTSGFPRVTGIKWIAATANPIIYLENSLASRVDHCFFDLTTGGGSAVYATGFYGNSYGVIDHNTIRNGIIGIRMTGASDAWSQPITYGGTNAMVLEDNLFTIDTDVNTFDHRVYHEQGARGVTRYCTFTTSAGLGQHGWIDYHGNQTYAEWGPPQNPSTVSFECYYNTMNFSASSRLVHGRGGQMIFFGNVMTCPSGGPDVVQLTDEEDWQTSFFGPAGPPWGPTASPATSHLRNVYPAQMQITNTFFSSNTFNGSPWTTVALQSAADSTFIQLNRDYWMQLPNATNGKPVGIYNGYVPLVYPHPLVGGAPPVTDPGQFTFIASNFPTTETSGSVPITVNRSGGAGAVTVTVTTSNDSATSGHDYTTTTTVLTWVDGATGARTFSIPILNSGDTATANRTFLVTMSAATGGATIAGTNPATVTIAMTRPAVTFLFNINSINPNSGVTIDVSPADANGLTSGGTAFMRTYPTNSSVMLAAPATAGGNSFTKWQRDGVDLSASANVAVNANAAHTFTAIYSTPPPPTVFQLSVSSVPSGAAITVSPVDNNGQGNGATAFSRLYTSGAVVSLTAPATGFQKWQRDGVDFSITAATSLTMGAAHSMTAFYALTNGGALAFSQSSYVVSSAAGSITLQVQASGSSNIERTVHWVTQSASATPGTDYATASGTLTWLVNNNGTQPITVTILPTGAIGGPPRVFRVLLDTPTGGAALGLAVATVSITPLQITGVQATVSPSGSLKIQGSVTVGR